MSHPEKYHTVTPTPVHTGFLSQENRLAIRMTAPIYPAEREIFLALVASLLGLDVCSSAPESVARFAKSRHPLVSVFFFSCFDRSLKIILRSEEFGGTVTSQNASIADSEQTGYRLPVDACENRSQELVPGVWRIYPSRRSPFWVAALLVVRLATYRARAAACRPPCTTCTSLCTTIL